MGRLGDISDLARAQPRSPQPRSHLLDAARQLIAPLLGSDNRILVGVTGPPAAGKSTLAVALAAAYERELGEHRAVAVPMDGFHLSNVELERLGLADRKGAPETFDAAGFVHLLGRLREPAADTIVYAPSFNRALNESIGSDIPVLPQARLVVVEGNYLLVDQGAWAGVRPLLDLVLYIDAPQPSRIGSLLRRQRGRGLAEAEARDWVFRSDEANARLIANTRSRADAVLTRPN